MAHVIPDAASKRVMHHILGPRGGLFALGMFVGAACMFYFLTNTIIAENKGHYESQIATLNARVSNLEAENQRISQRLEDIAFQRIND